MRNLLSSSERRRLELIETLLVMDDWTTLEWLASKLNTNSRTIREDIKYFRTKFDDFTISTNHDGVRIEFVPDGGLKRFYGQILRGSLPFNVLEEIFFDENLSVDELADKLYVSVSSIYRAIRQINNILTDNYKATIKTNPCRLIGNEKNIRNIYYAYFKEAYSILEWPFQAINEDDFNQSFKSLLRIFPFDISHVVDFAYVESVKIGVAVNKIRYSANHLLTDLPAEETAWSTQLIELLNSHQVNPFLSPNGKPLYENSRESFYQLYSPFLTIQTVFSEEMLLVQRKENSQLDKAINTFVSDILRYSDELGITVNADVAALALIGTFSIESDDPNNLFILFDRDYHFIRDFENRFPAVTDRIRKIIITFRQNLRLDLEEKNVNHGLYTLLTIWEDLFTQINEIYYSLKVTIISDGHKSHGKFLADFINSQLKVNPQFTVYNKLSISVDELDKIGSDLIITNFELPQDVTTPNVMIEHFPTKKDIQHIEESVRFIFNDRTS